MNANLDTRVHAMVARLYDAALSPHNWTSVLDDMAALCGGMGMTIFPMQAAPNGFSFVSAAVSEAANVYFTEWITRCPRIAYDARNPIINRCFWDGDILDEATLRGDPYFHDYARSYDLQYSVVRTTTALSDGVRHVISSPYSFKTGRPSDENMRLFELLTGHAVRAMAIHQTLGAARDTAEDLSRLLENRNCGVIIVNAAGYVTHMNTLAESLTQDGLLVLGRRLQTAVPGQQQAFNRALAAALSPDPSREMQPIALKRAGGRKPLIVQAAPLGHRQDRPLSRLTIGQSAIVVTLTDPELEPRPSSEHAFLLLGLTHAEARVAGALGQGESPQTVAGELDLSTGTVRNHMKSIFAKLDIARQSELVALAGRLSGIAKGP